MTPAEARGKQIYVAGVGSSEEGIIAILGNPPVEVPAAALPCAGCHGRDGRGRPEGGVTPTNLTREALSRSYGVRHASGREHPPYTPKLLKRAIAMGIDPAGNALNIAMPRYRLTHGEMADLLSYLLRLGGELDPGLSDDSIRLGTFVPPAGKGVASQAIESVLRGFFEDLNAAGGLYGRKIDLRVYPLPEDSDAVADLVLHEQLFALVGSYLGGHDEGEVFARLGELEVPLVAPFTSRPAVGFPVNRPVFYLLSGLAQQGRALAIFGHRPEGPAPALVSTEGAEAGALAEAIRGEVESLGGGEPIVVAVEVGGGATPFAEIAADLSRRGVEEVFLAGQGRELVAFLAAAETLGWSPRVFAVGSLTGRDLFEAEGRFSGRLFLSFPTLPRDSSGRGLEEFRAFARSHRLPSEGGSIQRLAMAAGRILVEGLKRSGRELSRERLIEELEGLYEFQTGLTPPVTYNPNRRVGALGAWIVEMDPAALRPKGEGTWVEVR